MTSIYAVVPFVCDYSQIASKQSNYNLFLAAYVYFQGPMNVIQRLEMLYHNRSNIGVILMGIKVVTNMI